jgi:hypothetical protein
MIWSAVIFEGTALLLDCIHSSRPGPIYSKAAGNVMQDRLARLPHFVTAMHNHEKAYHPRAMSRNRQKQLQTGPN